MKIDYKGYTVSQSSNNHVIIIKDNKIVFHAQCTKKLNQVELVEKVELYLKLCNEFKGIEDE